MRYSLLPALAATCLSALPAQALSARSTEPSTTSAAGTELAQARCYQVARYLPPNQLRHQPVGYDHLGRPIWLCCD